METARLVQVDGLEEVKIALPLPRFLQRTYKRISDAYSFCFGKRCAPCSNSPFSTDGVHSYLKHVLIVYLLCSQRIRILQGMCKFCIPLVHDRRGWG